VGRRFASIGAALTLALVLAGCGGESSGGDSVDARGWAQDVCRSAADWLEGNSVSAAEVQQEPEPSSPEAGRRVISEFMADIVERGDEMMGEVEAAGTPDVEGGAEARAEFVSVMQELVDAFRTASEEVETLPADESFNQELNATMTRMNERIDAIDATQVEDAMEGELQDHFDELPGCEAVRSNADG